MGTKCAPTFLPALGLLAGAVLAARLAVLPGPACALLAALGLALQRPAGRFVAFVALGLIQANLQWVEPRSALPSLRAERPVEIVGRIVAHPVRRDGDLLLRVRTRHVSQGHGRERRHLVQVALDVFVTLPATAGRPPAARPTSIGATVRLRGYLRRSVGFANSEHIRPGPWRLRLKSARFLEVEASPGLPARLAGFLRHHTEAAFGAAQRGGGGRAGARLARALLLGDRSDLPLAWQQALRRLGLTHLLAVSGLHMGLLVLLSFFLGRPLPRTLRYAATVAAVVAYLLLVGPRPSVVRASIMGLLALGALLSHRPPQALNALAWGVAALILTTPSVVMELGFQLSFAATAGLIVLSPIYAGRWRRLPRYLRQALAASFSAQVVTLPLLLPYTGSWHPLAVVLNLVAIPWLGLFLLVAFPWLLLTAVSVPTAALLRLLDLLASPLELLTRLPPSTADLQLLGGPAAGWTLTLILSLSLHWPRRVAAVTLMLASLSLTGAPRTREGPAEVVMLDVGQGDAVLLRDGRRTLLVDGGGWPRGDIGAGVLLPALAAAGVRRLDAVFLTHSDLDHCGGLADLVRYLPVGEIWTGPAGIEPGERTPCVERLLGAPGPRHRVLRRDAILTLGRWRLRVLHAAAGGRSKVNDLSVVLTARLGRRRVLLAGDLEAAGEAALLARLSDELRADVLKVAHHGSKTSTTPAWLRAVAPRIALISAGAGNLYGHPAPAVLDRLRRSSVRVLRTDRSGCVRLRFEDDGRILIDLPAASAVRLGT